MDFSQLPHSERPREKLIKHGPDSLSLAELLAILLRTGRKGEDVAALSQGLLRRMGGLAGLARATTAEMMQEKGLKEAKAARRRARTGEAYGAHEGSGEFGLARGAARKGL